MFVLPVFGNWEPENATNALLQGKLTGKLIHFHDIEPLWAAECPLPNMVNCGAGPNAHYAVNHWTWTDDLRKNWNNPSHQRSPINYFQGALAIDHVDTAGNYVYKYVGLERARHETVWRT